MKYDLQTIIRQYDSEKTISFVFFWGGQKSQGAIDSSCLSQWYPCSFSEDDVTYFTAEQYMMAAKARLFKDNATLAKIMSVSDPSLCKKLGRQVKNFVPEVWDTSKYNIVLTASLLKFSQNPDCQEYLLNTGNAVLVEASPYDCIWGVGLPKEDEHIHNPRCWRGENLLGFALMEARDMIRERITSNSAIIREMKEANPLNGALDVELIGSVDKKKSIAIAEAIKTHMTDDTGEICKAPSECIPTAPCTSSADGMEVPPPCRWRADSWKQSFESTVSRAANEDIRETLYKLRGSVFQNTLSIVRNGGYLSERGSDVRLPNPEAMMAGTCFYADEQPSCKEMPAKQHTEVEVLEEDCLLAANLLKKSGFNPAVLNMASRRNPGGGVLTGAGAQEENLFRRTNLCLSMYQFASYAEEYGLLKSENQYPLDPDFGGVYTPDACVFRGLEKEGYPLLDEWYSLSFISVAGLNRPTLDKNNFIVPEQVISIKNKIRTIFRMGLHHGHDALVLGALGCGAFRNPPAHIARLFHEIMEEEEFKDKYRKIVFAIIEDHNSRRKHNPEGNLIPFQREFSE